MYRLLYLLIVLVLAAQAAGIPAQTVTSQTEDD